MLQHFTRNIKRQVLAVYKALYKAKAVRQQIRTLIHNQNAVRIKLQSFFIALAVIIVACVAWNKEQSIISSGSFRTAANNFERFLIVKEFVPIKLLILFVCHFILIFAPNRHHGIECLKLCISLIFRLRILWSICRFLFHAALFKLHLDRIANIIAVFLHKALNRKAVKILVIGFFFGILRQQIQGDFCAAPFFFTGVNCISLYAAALPFPCFVTAIGLALYHYFRANHKRRIEPNTKLSDNVNIIRFFIVFLKIKRAGFCDRTQIVLQLFLRHATAIILNRQRTIFFVCCNPNLKIISRKTRISILQRLIIKLVNGIARITD